MLREITVSQLRWTLLILGGVFIGALALWERLRPRQARGRDASAPRPSEEPSLGPLLREREMPGPQAGPHAAEPWIADEPLEAPVEEPWHAAAPSDPLADLPTVLIDEPPESEPAGPAGPAEPAEPVPPTVHASWADTADTDAWERLEEGVGAVRILDTGPPAAAIPVLPAADPAEGVSASPEPAVLPSIEPELRVDWPPESERHILALRLIAGAERFPGRTLRLALAAEGFRLGRFDIFHKPDESGRALLSAASLTRPGTFDLNAMDVQRYSGLNLFAVLPGPLPPEQAFEALLAAADNLNERLQGEVQDEHGETLSAEGIERLRAALPEGAGGAALS